MKIALAQINPTVGDLCGNSRKIIDYAQQAYTEGAELAVFPELCVVGYPPQDLLENALFIEKVGRSLECIAEAVPPNLGIIIGAPTPNPKSFGKRLYNTALLYEGGKCLAQVHKTLLPTYDVFDEYRHFESAPKRQLVHWRSLKIGLHICEDMWNNEEQVEYHLYEETPPDQLVSAGAELLINISASPFSLGKQTDRHRIIENICTKHRIPFLLVNQVGGNTEIIYDGDSRVYSADGKCLLCAPSFQEALLFWNSEADLEPCTQQHDELADLHYALVLGIKDYFSKTGGFAKVLVGLSGGIDSAVTCALAVEALGCEQVVGVTMPSEYSTASSVDDSVALANNLGITLHQIPIKKAIAVFDEMLGDLFAHTEPGTTEENIQARTRGIVLMALSNKFNYLLLSSGNKSELAVGYVTLYGDTNGGVAVLSDVLKTRVYELAHYINNTANTTIIPEHTINKPPSAELKPDQKDTDSLPPYEVLDQILSRYIEQQQDFDEIVEETGIKRDLVLEILRQVDSNEYKRCQTPPGFRVTNKAFGIGRRLPIVMRWNRTFACEPD